MESPTCLCYFICCCMRIFSLDGKSVEQSTCGGILLAIVLVRETNVNWRTVCIFSSSRDLYSTVRSCLPDICLTLDWVRERGFRLGGIQLPSPKRTIRPEDAEGCDR